MTRALVTGFEPFGGADVNPSQLLVESLAADPPEGIELTTTVLPVSYAHAGAALERAVRAAAPDLVVCFGQADGRTGISVERFAHNLHDEASADNDGMVSSGPIDPDGPAARAATLPVDALVAALRAEGIPTAASRDAGGYLCNHVLYVLLGLLERERPETRGGFVHLPLLPEQALARPAATMPPETIVRAARVLLYAANPSAA